MDQGQKPAKVIFDTDIGGDCGDAGAMPLWDYEDIRSEIDVLIDTPPKLQPLKYRQIQTKPGGYS